MAAVGGGLEAATLQKLALRRKKVLSAEEMELYELAQAAGVAIDPDVFKILVDLLNLNVAPLAVFQMLKSMCAGQRLASDPQDPAAVSLPSSSVPETRDSHSTPALPHQPAKFTGDGELRLAKAPPKRDLVSVLSRRKKLPGRNRGGSALGGAPTLAERSSREGSSQRMPRQPSATRLPKGGGPGKSTSRSST